VNQIFSVTNHTTLHVGFFYFGACLLVGWVMKMSSNLYKKHLRKSSIICNWLNFSSPSVYLPESSFNHFIRFRRIRCRIWCFQISSIWSILRISGIVRSENTVFFFCPFQRFLPLQIFLQLFLLFVKVAFKVFRKWLIRSKW